jgi:hypothetical protein
LPLFSHIDICAILLSYLHLYYFEHIPLFIQAQEVARLKFSMEANLTRICRWFFMAAVSEPHKSCDHEVYLHLP